jgi:Fe-S cluster biogenesis protein NfuA
MSRPLIRSAGGDVAWAEQHADVALIGGAARGVCSSDVSALLAKAD